MRIRLNNVAYISLGLLGIYISLFQSIISAVSQHFLLTSAVTGFIISLHFIGSLIAPLILGEVSDRAGKKMVVIISFCAFVFGLSLMCFFNNLSLFAVGVLVNGGAFAVGEGVLLGVLADNNLEQTNRVINLSQIFFGVGALIGPVYMLGIIGLTRNWKANFLFLDILFGVILLFIFKLHFRNDKVPKEESASKNEGLISLKLLREKTFIFLSVALFIYVGIEDGVGFWLKTYLEKLFNPEQLGAYVLSGFWGGIILGRYISSRFEKNYRLFLIMGLTFALLISLCIGLTAQSISATSLLFIFLGLGFSVIAPMIMLISTKCHPEYTGTVFGVLMAFAAAGGMVFPFLIGVAAEYIGIQKVFFLIPILILTVFLFLIPVLKRTAQSD
ncbi:MAG: MFS transporter [Bacillota bacterium]